MARPPEPERRLELLDAAVDYVVAHGIADMKLAVFITISAFRIEGATGCRDLGSRPGSIASTWA